MIKTFSRLKIYGICVMISLSLAVNTQQSSKLPKKDRIDLAMDQELLMTKAPLSDKISKKHLLSARKYFEDLADQRNSEIQWEERGPNNVGGRTRALMYDRKDPSGKTVYAAGVSGGLWKTNDISSSDPNWQAVDDFFGSLAICAIVQDPSNLNVIYFGTGEGFFESNSNPGLGLWKSSNAGQSWQHISSTASDNFEFIQDIEVLSNGQVLVSTKKGLFKSSNGGSTWQKILGQGQSANSNHINKIEVANDQAVYATIGLFDQDGIYKSVNNGGSWTKLSSGLPQTGYRRVELAVAPSNPDVLYAMFENSSDSSCKGIYKSQDGGSSWLEVSNPSALGMSNFARTQAWYNFAITVDPNNSNKVFIGGIDLLSSSDGGLSWNQLTQWTRNGAFPYMHPDQHQLVFNPKNSNELLVGNDGGVWRSANASAALPNFQARNKGYNITQFYGAAVHPESGKDYFLAGAQDNGSQKFLVPGMNSTVEVSGGDGVKCYIDQDNPQIQITSYAYNNYFVSTNGGSSFNYYQLNNFGFFANPNCYDSDANILYASSSEGNLVRWVNPHLGSPAFQHIIITALNGQKASYVMESPNIPNRLYIGSSDGDVMYIDGANSGIFKSATVLRNENFGYVSGIDIEKGNEDHIVISYSNYGMSSVYETTDGGSTWDDLEGNLPDIPVRHLMVNPINPQEIFLATELGVWKSSANRSSGISWVPENAGMANVRVDELIYRASDKMLFAATHGRGLYSSGSLNGGTVPVALASFSVEHKSSSKLIELKWNAASEVNMEKYVIEKSFDGEVWDEIGEVEARNQNASLYQFEDRDLYVYNYNYYYRLRNVNLDGSFDYSEVRSIYLEKSQHAFIPNFFPNPFTDGIRIGDPNQYTKIEVNDINGVSILTIDKVEDYLDLSNLPSGAYVIVYTTKSGRKGLERVIKQSQGEEE